MRLSWWDVVTILLAAALVGWIAVPVVIRWLLW